MEYVPVFMMESTFDVNRAFDLTVPVHSLIFHAAGLFKVDGRAAATN